MQNCTQNKFKIGATLAPKNKGPANIAPALFLENQKPTHFSGEMQKLHSKRAGPTPNKFQNGVTKNKNNLKPAT